jgi:hypothetical protein
MHSTLEGHIAILWFGFSAEGEERRDATKRIWHLPKMKVISSGEVEGFKHEGRQVHWFDMYKDAYPIEEAYATVSLGAELKRALAPAAKITDNTANVFAAHLGVRPSQGHEVVAPTGSPSGVIARSVSIVAGTRRNNAGLLGLCGFLEGSGRGACDETNTQGLATFGLLSRDPSYDAMNEDTVVTTF